MLLSYLINCSKIPAFYINFLKNASEQKKIMLETISMDINKIKKDDDKSLTSQDFKKINTVYGNILPLILSEGFSILFGKNLTTKEKKALTFCAALSVLFDDFFDEKKTSLFHIKNLINKPLQNIHENAHEKLFVRFWLNAMKHSQDANLLKKNLLNVYEAQILSKKQEQNEIKQAEIKHITFQKGGSALLFYRSVFGDTDSHIEHQMFFDLGALIQLLDDIFDVYDDYQKGTKTLATVEKKMENYRKLYTELFQRVVIQVHQTDYLAENKEQFLRYISTVLCCGLVCIDKLEKNEKTTNGIFLIASYKRSELICDMDKRINQLKLVHYYAKQKTEKPMI